jgi:hypothetical protein
MTRHFASHGFVLFVILFSRCPNPAQADQYYIPYPCKLFVSSDSTACVREIRTDGQEWQFQLFRLEPLKAGQAKAKSSASRDLIPLPDQSPSLITEFRSSEPTQEVMVVGGQHPCIVGLGCPTHVKERAIWMYAGKDTAESWSLKEVFPDAKPLLRGPLIELFVWESDRPGRLHLAGLNDGNVYCAQLNVLEKKIEPRKTDIALKAIESKDPLARAQGLAVCHEGHLPVPNKVLTQVLNEVDLPDQCRIRCQAILWEQGDDTLRNQLLDFLKNPSGAVYLAPDFQSYRSHLARTVLIRAIEGRPQTARLMIADLIRDGVSYLEFSYAFTIHTDESRTILRKLLKDPPRRSRSIRSESADG